MLRFINNLSGIMGLTLSQIGLFLVTGILLTAVFTVIFQNDEQRTNELRAITSDFSSLMQDMDARFFEHITMYQFPEKDYSCTVHLSTEYIIVSTTGNLKNDLSIKERFVIRPWPRSSQMNWTTGEELHAYVNTTYGHLGTEDDPLTLENLRDFLEEWNTTVSSLAFQPLLLFQRNPVYIEKVFLFYNSETKYDLLLVYQLI